MSTPGKFTLNLSYLRFNFTEVNPQFPKGHIIRCLVACTDSVALRLAVQNIPDRLFDGALVLIQLNKAFPEFAGMRGCHRYGNHDGAGKYNNVYMAQLIDKHNFTIINTINKCI